MSHFGLQLFFLIVQTLQSHLRLSIDRHLQAFLLKDVELPRELQAATPFDVQIHLCRLQLPVILRTSIFKVSEVCLHSQPFIVGRFVGYAGISVRCLQAPQICFQAVPLGLEAVSFTFRHRESLLEVQLECGVGSETLQTSDFGRLSVALVPQHRKLLDSIVVTMDYLVKATGFVGQAVALCPQRPKLRVHFVVVALASVLQTSHLGGEAVPLSLFLRDFSADQLQALRMLAVALKLCCQ
mmetsp:Transcript_53295/g.142631  ORF Transcript_53295/g.142631 Transcript_53295/m.142631 type:complete len:240 (-) Transcript_53295:767-1486(-)|eukprot:CAMPEP_0194486236 /NCGR_PEP_ID=MMETSP0253-20130528/6967_1 /TAXON_ID=2966 /ORGANISM="Noctiluca scintillans" /LENGTH=239 /DNA_ID=CAMNT_0039326307 /DNA_START=145 /DNA_END=864 /DNA_ORIENTATION=+